MIATLRSLDEDGEIYLRKKIPWKAGDRTAVFNLNISNQDVEWPACLHVAVKSSPSPARTTGSKEAAGFLPPFVDVWSGALNPTKGVMESGFRVERRFNRFAERTVSLLEDAGDSIARHLWDGSLALAQHIDQTLSLQAPMALPLLEYVLVSATYRHFNVLELGCGCGPNGIALAQSIPDCNVLLTDLEEAEEVVLANINRMNPAISSKVAFAALDWTQSLPPKIEGRLNDLIIVSECTYNTETLQPLVDTLTSLIARSPKAVIVLATKTRHDSEAVFFDMMKTAGLIEEGKIRMKLPGSPGTGYADWATDVGVHVFKGREHRVSLSPRGSEEAVPVTGQAHNGNGIGTTHTRYPYE